MGMRPGRNGPDVLHFLAFGKPSGSQSGSASHDLRNPFGSQKHSLRKKTR